ncbi:MAG: regulatory protein RecX [Fidelibacterota bacterium]
MIKKNEITALKINVKNQKLRSIYVDGKYVISVSEGVLFQSDLKVGDRLTPEAVAALKAEEETYQIIQYAYRLLSFRPRSVQEMRSRLLQKGWGEEQVAKVLSKLEGDGYLDDRDFALMFAQDRVKSKFLGPTGLKSELFRKGIDRELISEVVENIYAQYPPAEIIHALMQKRGINPESILDPKEKRRFINQLKRKGFSWEAIESVVSKLRISSSEL